MRHTTLTAENFFRFHDRQIEFLGNADLADEVPILELAEDDGIRVLLSGWGGDEAFSAHGFGNIAKLIRRGQFIGAFRGSGVFPAGGETRGPPREDPGAMGSCAARTGLGLQSNFTLSGCFSGRCVSLARLARIAPNAPKWNGEDIRMIASPAQYLCNLIMMGHLGTRMSSWAAWSAPHGLQYRYPLTDRALMESESGVPAELYTEDGYGRYLPRTAFKSELPGLPHETRQGERKSFDPIVL